MTSSSEQRDSKRRLIIGITGATGAIYGIRLLQVLRTVPEVETHLIVSKAAEQVIAYETELTLRQVREMANVTYDVKDIAAPISSGSYAAEGMIIAPCSIKTLSAVASCFSLDLLSRAADVTLKEGRRLVLLVREAPLHLGHLRLMAQVAEMGAIIVPPVPAFYNFPKTVDDIINHTVGRILDLFHMDVDLVKRWEGMRTLAKSEVSST
ncbi:MAG: UbiX family flavin prenyltransferase [Acidobacteria bacterium]|nr:UbiX family flavin prenyltransferase [Acidobacteriota bacterium]